MPLARRRASMLAVLAVQMFLGAPAAADTLSRRNWFDTPFEQALAGAPQCPPPEGPLITEEEMRRQAHGRIERGTSCWLAGECADSNVYRRDPQVRQRAVEALRSDAALAGASAWLTTERRWVTVEGCVPSATVRAKLLARLRAVEGVERVLDKTMVGTAGLPPWQVYPAWSAAKKSRRGTPRRREGRAGRNCRRAKETTGLRMQVQIAAFEAVQPL